jgi:hypothetical protein
MNVPRRLAAVPDRIVGNSVPNADKLVPNLNGIRITQIVRALPFMLAGSATASLDTGVNTPFARANLGAACVNEQNGICAQRLRQALRDHGPNMVGRDVPSPN